MRSVTFPKGLTPLQVWPMKFETENIAVGEFVFIAVVEMCVAVAFSERVLFFFYQKTKQQAQAKQKNVCFRLPTVPKFRSPTLIFSLSFLVFHN